MKYIIAIISLAFILSSCDEINGPYKQDDKGKPNVEDFTRKVLLTEFTGMRCINCAEAAENAHELQEDNPNLVLLSVHTTVFAIPNNTYTKDFRSTEGTALGNKYKVAALPDALISRSQEKLFGPISWNPEVTKLLKTKSQVSIKVKTSIDDATKEIAVDVDMQFSRDIAKSPYLSIYLIENGVIYKQSDIRADLGFIEKYEHNNIMRAAFNGTWGDKITEAPIADADKISKKLKYTIPSNVDWNVKKLKIIAFVHDFDGNGEIWQVEEQEVPGYENGLH